MMFTILSRIFSLWKTLFVNDVEKKSTNPQNIETEFLDVNGSSKVLVRLPPTTKPHHKHYIGVDLQLDTGSEANILPENIFQQLFPHQHKLNAPCSTLTSYGGTKINNMGTYIMDEFREDDNLDPPNIQPNQQNPAHDIPNQYVNVPYRTRSGRTRCAR
ncbi:hypothetical protein LOTGIDRAFT_157173 [Lottia gigantea]|uniref:Peptidase A2 domain-containing protein n=1 Tax=Lottia gigantea TaxID=225164 RepID=V4AWY1_LOTGI|nr:hypothetical protein LOTGIDRAFT_157173 [Lottia gigantea]ESP02038.1 hypothetical protein LOTGIDRAFT_157173 [Lottia gigantea]